MRSRDGGERCRRWREISRIDGRSSYNAKVCQILLKRLTAVLRGVVTNRKSVNVVVEVSCVGIRVQDLPAVHIKLNSTTDLSYECHVIPRIGWQCRGGRNTDGTDRYRPLHDPASEFNPHISGATVGWVSRIGIRCITVQFNV